MTFQYSKITYWSYCLSCRFKNDSICLQVEPTMIFCIFVKLSFWFSICLFIFLIYCFYHPTCLCNNFYGLFALVCCWSSAFIRRIIYRFLNACPFDYTAVAVSGKVGIPLTGLTTPFGWLPLPKLTVLSRSAIVL